MAVIPSTMFAINNSYVMSKYIVHGTISAKDCISNLGFLRMFAQRIIRYGVVSFPSYYYEVREIDVPGTRLLPETAIKLKSVNNTSIPIELYTFNTWYQFSVRDDVSVNNFRLILAVI